MAELEKFDPSTLMQGVKERIKSTFVSLIPDDQWDAMVKKEIDAFFEPVKITYSRVVTHSIYTSNDTKVNGEMYQSPFRTMVWEFCAEKTYTILKEKLNEEYFGRLYPITDENIKDGLAQIVKDSVPNAITTFFETIARNSMNQLRDDIRNNRIY